MKREVDNIYFLSDNEIDEMEQKIGRQLVPLKGSEAEKFEKAAKNIKKKKNRNQPCVCGSGKKLKNCCLSLFISGKKPYKKSAAEVFIRRKNYG